MTVATLTAKGQLTVPVTVRRELRLEPGTKVDFVRVAEGRYEFVALNHTIGQLFGVLKREGDALSVDEMDAGVAAALRDDDNQTKR